MIRLLEESYGRKPLALTELTAAELRVTTGELVARSVAPWDVSSVARLAEDVVTAWLDADELDLDAANEVIDDDGASDTEPPIPTPRTEEAADALVKLSVDENMPGFVYVCGLTWVAEYAIDVGVASRGSSVM